MRFLVIRRGYMKWKHVSLGEILHVKHGWAFKGEYFSDEGDLLLLTPGNFLEEGGIRLRENKEKFYVGEFPNEYLLNKGDLLVVMTDLVQSAPILGGSAWVTSNNRYLHNQRLGKIVNINDDLVCKEFLYWIFNFDGYRSQVKGSASGATVRHTAPERIYKCKVHLPPIQIQQKIATILSAYDDLIENNLKRIKLLEEMAQITYEEWFVRLKFPDHETAVMDLETGLPVGWNEAEITAISFINSNSLKTRDAPEAIKYIDIASADTGFYQEPEIMSFAEAPSRARRKLNFGDTIFSTVRPNRKTYSLILEDDPMLVASTGFAVLTPKVEGTFSFVYLTVANQTFVDKAVSVAGGAAYPAINQNDFEKIKITKPNDDLIKLFSEKVINNFIAKRTLTNQNQLLKEARDILLPRLMTGIIDVDTL